jgi:hypothetical protein
MNLNRRATARRVKRQPSEIERDRLERLGWPDGPPALDGSDYGGLVPWAPPEDISAATTFVGMVREFERFSADISPESPVRGLLRGQLVTQQRAIQALIKWLTAVNTALLKRLVA